MENASDMQLKYLQENLSPRNTKSGNNDFPHQKNCRSKIQKRFQTYLKRVFLDPKKQKFPPIKRFI